MGGIKIPNFYASPLHKNKMVSIGENTDKIKTDKKGEYSLVTEDTVNLSAGDTIRPANNKSFKPAVIGKSLGSEGGYLVGGDYNVSKTGNKSFQISPNLKTKFGGTPDNTEEQAAREKATEELYAEGKITETDDKAMRLIKKRVKKNAKKLSK